MILDDAYLIRVSEKISQPTPEARTDIYKKHDITRRSGHLRPSLDRPHSLPRFHDDLPDWRLAIAVASDKFPGGGEALNQSFAARFHVGRLSRLQYGFIDGAEETMTIRGI